jgi:hypothetical protein
MWASSWSPYLPPVLSMIRGLDLLSDTQVAAKLAAQRAGAPGDVRPVKEIAAGDALSVAVSPYMLLLSLTRALSSFPSLTRTLHQAFDLDALRLSGHWAVLKYLWAFEDGRDRIALSRNLDLITGHQRGVVSEDLSIATAVHVVEALLFTSATQPAVVDVDAIEQDPWLPTIFLPRGRRMRPDYLFYDPRYRQQLVALEVKGINRSPAALIKQMTHGVDQVLAIPDVVGVQVRRVVIGTIAARGRLRVYAVEVSGPADARRRARRRLIEHARRAGAPAPVELPDNEERLIAASPLNDQIADEIPNEVSEEEVFVAAEGADNARLASFAGRTATGPQRTAGNLWQSLELDSLPVANSDAGPLRGTTREIGMGSHTISVFLGVRERSLRLLGTDQTLRRQRSLAEDPLFDAVQLPSTAPHIRMGIQVSRPGQSGEPLYGLVASDGCVLAIASET